MSQPEPLRVLLLEDDPNDALLLERALRQGGFAPELQRVDNPLAFDRAIAAGPWDVIISDYNLPEFSGLDALQLLKERELDLPFIIASGEIGESVAVDTMRAGAHDYVLKDNLARLVPAVRREVREARLRREQRAARAALSAAEDRWRLVLQANNDGVWDTDFRTRHTWYSPRWKEIYGVAPGDPGPQQRDEYLAFVHPDDVERALASITRLYASPTVDQSVERFRIRRRDGSVRWILARNTAVRDETGTVVRIVGTHLDITEQTRIEEAIHAIAQGTAFLTDAEYVRHLVIELARLSGARYAFVARAGDPAQDSAQTVVLAEQGVVIPNVSWPLSQSPCAEVLDADVCAVGRGVAAAYPHDDLLRDMSAECYVGCVLRDDAGTVHGYMAIVDDRDRTDDLEFLQRLLSIFALRTATELRRAAAVRALERRDYAMNRAPDSIYYIDTGGRIAWVNDTACAQLGYSRAELLGKSILDIDPTVDHVRGKELFEDLQVHGHHRIRSTHRTKGGVDFPVEISSAMVRDGDGTFAISFVRDISEQVRVEAEKRSLQEALLQSQKMEALGTLAGGIAHDFNNILTGIAGNTQLARSSLAPDAEERSRLDAVLAAVDRARDVVQRILTFSRHQRTQRRPVILAEVVDEATRLMRASLPSSIALQSSASAGRATVMADASQLHQVLLNLCTNAAHAISAARSHGGTVAIDVARTTVAAEQAQRLPGLTPGPHVVLAVQDNGGGLADDIRTRIFEPFFTTKPAGEGTGLGLAVVHGIVREHGGAIEVESGPGEGTTFRLYFPECSVPDEPVTEAPQATEARGFGHILLVDDEASIAYVSARLLEAGGFTVTSFTDPRQAAEAFEQAPDGFAAMVTDLTMPKLSGLELVRLVRAVRPDLPVVVATGYLQGLSEATVAALRVAVLLKPYDGDDLCAATAQVIAAARRAAGGGDA